ncbi:MAG: hypothetical protein IPJ41_10180 [Phycisphaerales bacterium]|nr:hypothetical protein [Phycisphaerales bacterium]
MMHDTPESRRQFERSLHAVASHDWPGSGANARVDAFLSRSSPAPSRSRPGLPLWIGIGTLALAGAGYAGTRIYEHYTLRLTVNGTTTEHQVEIGDDGTGTLVMPLNGGDQATFVVGPDNAGPDGSIQVELRLDSTGQGDGSPTEIQIDGSLVTRGN